MTVRLDPSWKALLRDELLGPVFTELADFVRAEYLSKKIYPPPAQVFYALDMCPVDRVRVVILGQDPYHGAGQAHGLSFSVASGTRLPPSLQNIFKELRDDLGIPMSTTGDLTKWAEQGVLLLNATLTVEAGKPGSHQKHGWEAFTDGIMKELSAKKEHLVFILWGKFAQQKAEFIDETKHLVLKAAHPSPYSASSGFFGSKPFSQTNAYLVQNGYAAIDWRL
ncbi:uracil-DNA glycosylase [Patescibacteria group bacterium]|nr:uracil-DNA glycosylase [Patescibacteria group bacterium]